MALEKNIIDVDQASFAKEVVERSAKVPVLVDFWAPWCAPCRALGPILEKLAKEMNGRFLLAKINTDQNPGVAKQFNIRGIPAVKLLVNGQVVDEFTGALPEPALRQFLDRALKSDADKQANQGAMFEGQGDLEQAAACYREVLEIEPHHPGAILGLTRILLSLGQVAEAKEQFGQLDAKAAASPEAKSLAARIAFAENPVDMAALERAVAANPRDLGARLALGRALIAHNRTREAMDQFLEIVGIDREFQEDIGRKSLLQAFDLLGPGHPLVAEYRPRLSGLLFR